MFYDLHPGSLTVRPWKFTFPRGKKDPLPFPPFFRGELLNFRGVRMNPWRIMPVSKRWITMVIGKSPIPGVMGPLPNGRTLWLIHGGPIRITTRPIPGSPILLTVRTTPGLGLTHLRPGPYGRPLGRPCPWQKPGKMPLEPVTCLAFWHTHFF